MQYSVHDVFKPGSFPETTYVDRNSDWVDTTYEQRLRQALKITGFLTCIVGTSKIGKTILCEKVIPEGLVRLTGNDFSLEEDIWTTISRQAEMPVEGSVGKQISSRMNDILYAKGRFRMNKNDVIRFFIENHKTLLIDDFHSVKPEMRITLAQQLKDAIGKELNAIVVSLPHLEDELIRKNRDLSGRISIINIAPWEKEDLKSIASSGFDKLGIRYDDKILDYIAAESLSSPQLMQAVCLNVGLILEQKGSLEKSTITEEICQTAFKRLTASYDHRDIARLLKKGPALRGAERKKYELKNGEFKDLYQLILDALVKDPSTISISVDDLKNRITCFLSPKQKGTPNKGTIKNSLRHLVDLMNSKDSDQFKVFDIKDDEMIHIIDPQFLFYLRWGD